VLYAIACPSVRLSVTRVDHTKTVEDMIMKFTPYGTMRKSLIALLIVVCGKSL